MMAARGDPEEDLAAASSNTGVHDGDVGQMRAAVVGRVEREDVARAACRPRSARMIVSTERSIEPRWTGMCGALATSAPSRVEDRAGEIEPLLDVHRIGGVLQRHAHLLGDRHEEVVEHLEHDRIGIGADRAARAAAARRGSARDGRCAVSSRLPARLDDDRLVRLDDQRRAVDALRRRCELLARIDAARRARRPARRTACAARGLGRGARRAPRRWLAPSVAPPPTASTDSASTMSGLPCDRRSRSAADAPLRTRRVISRSDGRPRALQLDRHDRAPYRCRRSADAHAAMHVAMSLAAPRPGAATLGRAAACARALRRSARAAASTAASASSRARHAPAARSARMSARPMP